MQVVESWQGIWREGTNRTCIPGGNRVWLSLTPSGGGAHLIVNPPCSHPISSKQAGRQAGR